MGAVGKPRPPTATESTGAHSRTFLCDGEGARWAGDPVDGSWPRRNLRVLCIVVRLQWLSGGMMRVLFIAMVVVGLIGFASMVAFVLR